MGAPQTLPANFDGWDKPPDTLPKDFSGWDVGKTVQPSAASRFGSNLLTGAGMVSQEQGKRFFTHPLDVLHDMAQQQGELGARAGKELKNKEYVRGLTHAVEYLLPGLGPTLAHSGDQLESGDVAGGVGTMVGAALPMAIGSAAPKVKIPVGALPERLYQSALKPSTAYSPSEVSGMVKTGIANEIPVSEPGLAKLSQLISDANQSAKALIAADPSRPINKFSVTSRLADTAKRFSTQVNPEADLNAISDSGNEFLRNQPGEIPASEAQALKQGTYQQLKAKSYGELKSASIESQKALARGIKEELNTAFPELQGINAEASKLYGLDEALTKAVQRQANHQLIGLGTPAAAAAGGILTGSGTGALVSAVLKGVIDDPVFKSRFAFVLSKARKGMPFGEATGRIAAYSSALGDAANGQQNEHPPNE